MTGRPITVVIPTYNRAALLRRAVVSALAQTLAPLEILVIDDGSTDETAAVCAEWGPPVRAIATPNGGVARARNIGVGEARGEWIAFLDSDDEWEPQKLAVQSAVLDAVPDARWSVTGCELIDGDGRSRPGRQGYEAAFPVFSERQESADTHFGRRLRRVTVDGHTVYAGDLYETLFFGNVVLPSSALVHRSVFERVGVFDPAFRYAEETEFFHRVAAAAPVAIVLSRLVRYRVAQAGSLTSSGNAQKLIVNALKSLDQAARLRDPLPTTAVRALREGRTGLLMRLAYTRLSELDTRGARDAAMQAVAAGGWMMPRAWGIVALGLLPPPVLRGMHGLKKMARR